MRSGNDGSRKPIRATGDHSLVPFIAALKDGFRLRAVALFGSRARGDHLPDSDFDLAVVSDDFAGLDRLRRRLRVYEVWYDFGPDADADIFALTPDELQAMQGPLIWDMLEDGLPLLDDGTWREASREFRRRRAAGLIVPVEGGWRLGERGPA